MTGNATGDVTGNATGNGRLNAREFNGLDRAGYGREGSKTLGFCQAETAVVVGEVATIK